MRSLTTLFLLLMVFMAPGSLAYAQSTEHPGKANVAASDSAT